MTERRFPCYPKHMANTLHDEVQGWVDPEDQTTVVVDFFKRVVQNRAEKQFYIHGADKGYGEWQPGDVIAFCLQGTGTVCAKATLVSWEAAAAGALPYFRLRDVQIVVRALRAPS